MKSKPYILSFLMFFLAFNSLVLAETVIKDLDIEDISSPFSDQVLILNLGQENWENERLTALVTDEGFMILSSAASSTVSSGLVVPSFKVVEIGLNAHGNSFKKHPLISQRGFITGDLIVLNRDAALKFQESLRTIKVGDELSLSNFIEAPVAKGGYRISEQLGPVAANNRSSSSLTAIIVSSVFLGIFFSESYSGKLNPEQLEGFSKFLISGVSSFKLMISSSVAAWAMLGLSDSLFPSLKAPSGRNKVAKVVGVTSTVLCVLALKYLAK